MRQIDTVAGMGNTTSVGTTVRVWPVPPGWLGAVIGAVVVLGFTAVHDVFISDIWFNAGPMVFAGALCGYCLTWSYRASAREHSTATWFGYNAVYAVELIGLGGVSLIVLQPRFTMAELLVADDAFERLMPPAVPLMGAAIVVGTILVWLYCGRRLQAVIPILATQVVLVFLLGHQFAFLGLVEASSTLMVVFAEFAVITAGLAVAFGTGVMWATMAFLHVRRPDATDPKPRFGRPR